VSRRPAPVDAPGHSPAGRGPRRHSPTGGLSAERLNQTQWLPCAAVGCGGRATHATVRQFRMLGLVVAAALLVVPGWTLAGIVGLSTLGRAAVAPAASVALWALAAALLGLVGIGPSPAPTLAVLVALVAGAGLLQLRLGGGLPRLRAAQWSPRKLVTPLRTAVVLGVSGGLVLAVHTWTSAWPSLQALSHFSDMTWHGYVVALFAHGTPANPFTLVPVDPQAAGASQSYPWGVHLIAALVQQITGSTIPVAIKVTQVAFLGVAYPLGCATVALHAARGSVRLRVVAATVAPVIAMGLNVFPWHIDPWLVFPCAVGLIPGTAVAAWTVAGKSRRKPARAGSPASGPVRLGWLAVGMGAAGVTVVHPSATVALSLLVLAGVMLGTKRFGEFAPRWPAVMRLVVPGVFGLVLGAFFVGRTILLSGQVAGFQRQVSRTFGYWLWIVATGGTRQPQTLMFALMVAAAVCAIVRGVMLGPILFAAVFLALAASAQSSGSGFLHDVTALWYHEGERLAAIAVVVVGAVVATQVAWLVDRLLDLAARATGLAVQVINPVVVCAAVLAAALAVTWPQLGSNVVWVASFYRPTPLTAGHVKAFAWLRDNSAGHPVMNPATGITGWMYALDGVVPVIAHGSVAEVVPARGFLALCLNRIDIDPRVRPLVDSLKIEYVIVDADTSDGLLGLDANRAFREVERWGSVTVYRILPAGAGASASQPAACAPTVLPGWWLNEKGPYHVEVALAAG